MRPHHFLLSVLIAAVWGFNFIFVQLGLHDVPPLMLCALRFFFSSIPAVFFIKKPNISWKWLFLYGFFTLGLQFAFLFMGMHAGMSPGLTSLIAQTQVFFSLFFAVLLLKEQLKKSHILGAIFAFSGIGIVWVHLSGEASLSGFICIILGAASWGFGNFITKKIGPVNGIALVVWGSFIACPILFACSLLFEGSHQLFYSMHHLSGLSILSIAYIVYISTWFGYGTWNWLLAKYTISTIAPFTLLVPVFGIISASLILEEPMQAWKELACGLVMFGLCIHTFGPRLFAANSWQKLMGWINRAEREA